MRTTSEQRAEWAVRGVAAIAADCPGTTPLLGPGQFVPLLADFADLEGEVERLRSRDALVRLLKCAAADFAIVLRVEAAAEILASAVTIIAEGLPQEWSPDWVPTHK